jgi:hypothetical protein
MAIYFNVSSLREWNIFKVEGEPNIRAARVKLASRL